MNKYLFGSNFFLFVNFIYGQDVVDLNSLHSDTLDWGSINQILNVHQHDIQQMSIRKVWYIDQMKDTILNEFDVDGRIISGTTREFKVTFIYGDNGIVQFVKSFKSQPIDQISFVKYTSNARINQIVTQEGERLIIDMKIRYKSNGNREISVKFPETDSSFVVQFKKKKITENLQRVECYWQDQLIMSKEYLNNILTYKYFSPIGQLPMEIINTTWENEGISISTSRFIQLKGSAKLSCSFWNRVNGNLEATYLISLNSLNLQKYPVERSFIYKYNDIGYLDEVQYYTLNESVPSYVAKYHYEFFP